MKVLVEELAYRNERFWRISIRRGAADLGRLFVGQNAPTDWKAAWAALHNQCPDALKTVLSNARELLACYQSVSHPKVFLSAIHGLMLFLLEAQEQGIAQTGSRDSICELARFLFTFQAESLGVDGFRIAILLKDHIVFEGIHAETEPKWTSVPADVCLAILASAYDKAPETVNWIIENYTAISISLGDRPIGEDDPVREFTFRTFIELSKALVEFLVREIPGPALYRHSIPEISAFVVKNEQDHEEQKVFLERILSYPERTEDKLRRLRAIVDDLHRSYSSDRTKKSQQRLIGVTSLVSDYYLGMYDLDKSAEFWERSVERPETPDDGERRSPITRWRRDPVLCLFLSLHRRPYIHLIMQVILLGALSVFSYQNWHCEDLFPLQVQLFNLQVLPMLGLYLFLLALLVCILVQILRKQWLYSQLLLPRLFGAAVVGLTPLLLDDLPWKIGIRSDPVNWFLIALLTYAGSFIYIFIEVYNTTKFVRERSMADAIKASSKIFLIALSETLLVVTAASSLFFPTIRLTGDSCDKLGIFVELFTDLAPRFPQPWLSFGFYPTLVLMWTGIALFIGSFVQLMWQERQITASI